MGSVAWVASEATVEGMAAMAEGMAAMVVTAAGIKVTAVTQGMEDTKVRGTAVTQATVGQVTEVIAEDTVDQGTEVIAEGTEVTPVPVTEALVLEGIEEDTGVNNMD